MSESGRLRGDFVSSSRVPASRENRVLEWAAVAGVFGMIVIAAATWLAIDRQPPEWDYANHLESALRCRRDLAAADVGAVFARSSFYPPLIPCLAGLVYTFVPSDVVYGEIVVLAFLGVGMAATYVLARCFAGGAGGVIAATLFGTAPVVVNHTLHFQLDVPLAAMVAAFLAVLLVSDRFSRPGWTMATGILLGLGLLTKPPFVLFVAPAGLLVIAGARGHRAWLRAGSAALLGTLIALPWYGPRAFGLSTQIQNRSFKQAGEAGAPAALSPSSLAYYPLNFPLQFGLIAVLLLLIGLGVAIHRRCWYVLAGLAPLLVLIVLQNKQMRYALPLLPMASVAGAIGFAALPRSGRFLAGFAVVAAALIQLSSTVFAVPAVARLPILGGLPIEATPPSPANWQQRAVFDLIVRDSGAAPRTVSVVANHAHFSPSNFRYYALRDDLRLRVARAWEGEPIGVEYMIVKTGDLGPWWSIDKARRVTERLATDASLARAFPIIGEFPLPDGSTASVRARRLPTELEVNPETLARLVADGVRARLAEVIRDVEGLEVRLDADHHIVSGHIRRLEIRAEAATVGELRRPQAAQLRLRNLRLVVDDVVFNPWSTVLGGRFDPLDAGRLTIERATIDAADLQSFIRHVKGLGRLSLSLGAGFVDLNFALPGPDVAARMQLVAAADTLLVLVAERVSIGGVPVPSVFVDWVMASFDPSRGISARLPFPATMRPVIVTPRAIRVGES